MQTLYSLATWSGNGEGGPVIDGAIHCDGFDHFGHSPRVAKKNDPRDR